MILQNEREELAWVIAYTAAMCMPASDDDTPWAFYADLMIRGLRDRVPGGK